MKYEWNSEKNAWLKNNRKISFEKIVFHLMRGDVWKVAEHPNQDKYKEQMIYFVEIDGYIYLVPFVAGSNYIFLKTIIPSRKATKLYQKETTDEI